MQETSETFSTHPLESLLSAKVEKGTLTRDRLTKQKVNFVGAIIRGWGTCGALQSF